MRVIELIEELQAMLEQHGNCEVVYRYERISYLEREEATEEYSETIVLI